MLSRCALTHTAQLTYYSLEHIYFNIVEAQPFVLMGIEFRFFLGNDASSLNSGMAFACTRIASRNFSVKHAGPKCPSRS